MAPKGWRNLILGSIANVTSGGTPDRSNQEFWTGGEIPWVKTTEIQNCVIHKDDIGEYITAKGLEKSSTKIIPAGSVLMAMIGQGKTRGQVALLQVNAAINQNCAAITFKEGHCSEFYFNYLKSKYEVVRNLSNSGGQSNLNGAIVKAIKILVPPFSEQKKIAEILSTWDKAIETVEKLLAQSRQQKKALMQQLLTGERRLPKFSGKWNNMPLSSVAQILVSNVDKKSDDGEVKVKLCNYTDVYYNTYITGDMPFMDASANQREIAKFTLKKGDVIITKDSETPGDIAIPAYVKEDLGGVICGYHLAIIRPKERQLDGYFLSQVFSLPHVRYYFFSLATGATRFGLSIGAIEGATIKIPEITEQRKIAAIISNADAEIAALKTKLSYLNQEKRALMQQLLSGKKRVKTGDLFND